MNARGFRPPYVMSGFYAVSFALNACDRISVYGMDPWVDAGFGPGGRRAADRAGVGGRGGRFELNPSDQQL